MKPEAKVITWSEWQREMDVLAKELGLMPPIGSSHIKFGIQDLKDTIHAMALEAREDTEVIKKAYLEGLDDGLNANTEDMSYAQLWDDSLAKIAAVKKE